MSVVFELLEAGDISRRINRQNYPNVAKDANSPMTAFEAKDSPQAIYSAYYNSVTSNTLEGLLAEHTIEDRLYRN